MTVEKVGVIPNSAPVAHSCRSLCHRGGWQLLSLPWLRILQGDQALSPFLTLTSEGKGWSTAGK